MAGKREHHGVVEGLAEVIRSDPRIAVASHTATLSGSPGAAATAPSKRPFASIPATLRPAKRAVSRSIPGGLGGCNGRFRRGAAAFFPPGCAAADAVPSLPVWRR